MDLFVRDLRQDGPLIMAGCVKCCSESFGEREQAKERLRLALENQWRKQARQSSLTPLHYSFSHLAGQTWAAATSQGWDIGIDAARDCEFAQPYPLHKVFHPQELFRMEPAQIWSGKEAVVKAIGCGFDGLSPLDIRLVTHCSANVANRGDGIGLPTPFQLWSWRLGDGGWVTVAYQRKPQLMATGRLNV